MTRLGALVLVAALLSGCGDDGATTFPGTAGTTAATTSTSTAGDEPGDEPAANLPAVLGLQEITLLTATSGVGIRPILEWEAVDGAVGYEVALNAPGGSIYWAGWATGTSIPVGGEPLIDPAFSGPSVSAGMTWSVAAYDASGYLVAVSAMRPISP
ncbi:MAG: hypothetical protein WD184_05280 [Acidimicrobiia bacterium]